VFDPILFATSALNGVLLGGVYALIALGLTLIYGVLHIINFAHGSLLMLALYGVFFLVAATGINPYLALPILTIGFFALGYVLQRSVIAKASHGRDENVLLVTLGVSIIIENLALFFWKADTRSLDFPLSFETVDLGFTFVPLTSVIAFGGAVLVALGLWLMIGFTDLGKAIRAVAKERQGAKLVGIDVDHMFAMSFGIGTAVLGAAACLMLPMFYVSPSVGHVFVLIAFTVVVLGGMGSFPGALIGGLIIGLTESLGSLYLGESLGQLGVFVIFIAVLLFRPTGLFGARA
jgi:branched-chain amino acid transport system permease protein